MDVGAALTPPGRACSVDYAQKAVPLFRAYMPILKPAREKSPGLHSDSHLTRRSGPSVALNVGID